jgi:hypothetical protein
VTTSRPPIPAALRREISCEAGHRCAIPTCRQTPIEIHHIEPWATVKVHEAHNLIALCPTDHARVEAGQIDRPSVRRYKQNLALVNSRYSESERRLLGMFAEDPSSTVRVFPRNMDFDFLYLIKDGLLTGTQQWMTPGDLESGVQPSHYELTAEGVDFVAAWRAGNDLDPEAGDGEP